jgi:N-acetylglucosaminyldiphosphoundecaprenol N-acetyl-beta-D-mannosaminyltransferase
MNVNPNRKTVKVVGIPVDPLDMERTIAYIAEQVEARRKGYICLIGVHGIMEAQRDPELAQIYARADLMVPDGMPTVWLGHAQGFSEMQRVAGPDLMLEVFRRKEFSNATHFLYSTPAAAAVTPTAAASARPSSHARSRSPSLPSSARACSCVVSARP